MQDKIGSLFVLPYQGVYSRARPGCSARLTQAVYKLKRLTATQAVFEGVSDHVRFDEARAHLKNGYVIGFVEIPFFECTPELQQEIDADVQEINAFMEQKKRFMGVFDAINNAHTRGTLSAAEMGALCDLWEKIKADKDQAARDFFDAYTSRTTNEEAHQ